MKTAKRLRYVLALGLVAGVMAGPAAAHHGADGHGPCTDENGVLKFDELQQHVSAPARKIGNLAAMGLGQGDTFPTWDGTAPTQSFQQGGGGVTVTHRMPFNPLGSEYDPRGSAYMEGGFNGCLNNIAFDLIIGSPVPPNGGTIVTDLRLSIDGTQVYQTPADPGPSINAPAHGSSGAMWKMRFAFTNIHALMASSPADYQPLEGPHTIALTFFSQYVDDASYSFLYDATDAPSSLLFNRKASLSQYSKIDVSAV